MFRLGFVIGALALALALSAGTALAVPGQRPAVHTWPIAAGPASHERPVSAIAHRGASAYAPENTVAAIDEAYARGAHTVEVDVQRTADGKLVLMHDTSLERTTDAEEVFPGRSSYSIGDFTLADIRRLDAGSWFDRAYAGERVPTLGEALDRLSALDMNLLLEIKAPELYPGIERDVRRELAGRPRWLTANGPGRPHRLVIQSFDWDVVRKSKDNLYGIPHALLGKVDEDSLDEYSWADQINPNHTRIDARYVRQVRAAGFEIFPYTINDSQRMREVLRMGVDGFITDYPDVGRKAVEEHLG